jgi:5-carboxymethyl-2-hydroxymuconate isomerase
MPHLTLEYSNNLPQFDADAALLAMNQTLLASGQFEEVDIKSRAIPMGSFLIGTSHTGRAFVHAKLALLSGRSVEIKQEISQNLLDTLQAVCDWPQALQVQLCVEVQEIERQSYAKMSIG